MLPQTMELYGKVLDFRALAVRVDRILVPQPEPLAQRKP
jgi:hypothetical protein